LVVNEAMASGLPVLCSRYAGCAEELIIPGQTGEVFDPTDTQTLRDLLARWLQTPYTTPDPAIQAHIQHWDFERSVSGILEQLTRVGVLSPPQSIQADPHEP
jgi:glycosyltransferase involved in cell wall biosynthesis